MQMKIKLPYEMPGKQLADLVENAIKCLEPAYFIEISSVIGYSLGDNNIKEEEQKRVIKIIEKRSAVESFRRLLHSENVFSMIIELEPAKTYSSISAELSKPGRDPDGLPRYYSGISLEREYISPDSFQAHKKSLEKFLEEVSLRIQEIRST